MKSDTGIFVKITYRWNEETREKLKDNDFKISANKFSKYFLCRGIFNRKCTSLVFKVNNLEDAEYLKSNNPFNGTNFYSAEILNFI
jgi:hypothetical protein